MGKYMRKCKGVGEVAVMELAQVGVRTRARALAMAAAVGAGATKRRRVVRGELKLSSSCIQLRSRRRIAITPEHSVSRVNPRNLGRTAREDRCSSPSSDHVPTSCCSSNGSSQFVEERMKFVDLEDEGATIETSTYFDSRERRPMSPPIERAESDEKESTARSSEETDKPSEETKRPSEATAMSSEANSRLRSTVGMMPTEAELEEFFGAQEKDLLKRFSEKYNFDFVNEVPLEGRYEWVPLKP